MNYDVQPRSPYRDGTIRLHSSFGKPRRRRGPLHIRVLLAVDLAWWIAGTLAIGAVLLVIELVRRHSGG